MKKLVQACALGIGALGLSSIVFAGSLVELLEAKQFDEAKQLISLGVEINEPSPDGTTALHWAAYYDDADMVKRLLRAEAEPNVRNDYGSTPLGEAAKIGNVETLEMLLDAGADVESPNLEGQTALMAVARTGNVAAAKLLIKHGADVNATEAWGGQTALMWAAARKHPEMIKYLAKKGANVDQRAIDREWDRRVTSEPRVKEMFTGGFTALLYAVREDCLACVKELLKAGADINKPDPENVSPLVLALLNMRFDIAKYLVEQGADVNQWDYWGRTPLFAAADLNILPASMRGDVKPVLQKTTGVEVAKMLLERGANPDYALKLAPPPRNITHDRAGDFPVMNTGSTPLQRAAYGADIEMMKLLLDHGARMDLANVFGVTPLIALTAQGGSRNRNKNEQTVIECLKVLIAAGGDINQPGGNFNETPLHTSVRLNWFDVVEFLVQNGADLNARDSRGLIPLDYALGKADTQSLGNFNVVGELPEMAALIRGYMEGAD